MINVTIIIIAITSLISFTAFKNAALVQKYIFYPPALKNKQWYRMLTYGFLHADLSHLIFNMFALYLFGTEIESVFIEVFGHKAGILLFVLLYFSGLFFSILPTYYKEKNNSAYRSLGASGAVSSIVFAYILVYPMSFMGIVFVPVYLPAFIFGIIYIVTSIYLDKNQHGNINHMAHISGGIYGIVFMYVVFAAFANVNIFYHFVENIQISSIADLIHVGY